MENLQVVRTTGIEPVRIAPRDFKSLASTSSATSARLVSHGSDGVRQLMFSNTCHESSWQVSVSTGEGSSRTAGYPPAAIDKTLNGVVMTMSATDPTA